MMKEYRKISRKFSKVQTQNNSLDYKKIKIINCQRLRELPAKLSLLLPSDIRFRHEHFVD